MTQKQKKLPLKDILAAIDMNGRDVWDELSEEEKKEVNFWLLNRYASSVKGTREEQELAVLKTNEYYNKHYSSIGVGKENGHPKLMWHLLCLSGNTGDIKFHPWIGFKKKHGSNNSQAEKLVKKIYPNMKQDEVEQFVSINSKQELRKLAEEHGFESFKL